MRSLTQSIAYRTVGEWELDSQQPYENPFADVAVDATFTSPTGNTFTIPGFYDGAHHGGANIWRARFNPNEAGQWTYCVSSRPANPDLTLDGTFEVTPGQARGYLRATPGRAWGFHLPAASPPIQRRLMPSCSRNGAPGMRRMVG